MPESETRSETRSNQMRERILETADRLFYGQGIRAVGVDTVAAEIGISKRTLYNYFPSKDELIVAYLQRRLRPAPPSDLPPAAADPRQFRAAGADLRHQRVPRLPVRQCGGRAQGARPRRQQVAFAFKEQRRLWFRDLLAKLEVMDPDTLACSCRSWPTARSPPRWCAAIPRSPHGGRGRAGPAEGRRRQVAGGQRQPRR